MQRRGLPDGWVIFARPAHPALVSEEDFIAVQGIRAARQDADPARRYRLAGLLRGRLSWDLPAHAVTHGN